MLQKGDKAPEFRLRGLTQDGEKEYVLADFRGKWVILYFYPKDDTPGCTTEACEFRDAATTVSGKNAVVLGVSRDSIKSHEKFIQKFNLPFILLADIESKVCEMYKVIKEKNMYGKKVMGIERSTFLIDPEGKVAEAWRGVRAEGHAGEVLKKMKNEE
ncbi:MAG: peroxiredoxin [Patescibacteria group bacterium]